MAENGTLSAKQYKAIQALLTERTNAAAAIVAGVSIRSLYRWLENGDFRAELARQQSEMVSEACRALLVMQSESRETLHQVQVDPAAKNADKIRAAVAVMVGGARWWEVYNLEDRVQRLEAAQNANPHSED